MSSQQSIAKYFSNTTTPSSVKSDDLSRTPSSPLTDVNSKRKATPSKKSPAVMEKVDLNHKLISKNNIDKDLKKASSEVNNVAALASTDNPDRPVVPNNYNSDDDDKPIAKKIKIDQSKLRKLKSEPTVKRKVAKTQAKPAVNDLARFFQMAEKQAVINHKLTTLSKMSPQSKAGKSTSQQLPQNASLQGKLVNLKNELVPTARAGTSASANPKPPVLQPMQLPTKFPKMSIQQQPSSSSKWSPSRKGAGALETYRNLVKANQLPLLKSVDLPKMSKEYLKYSKLLPKTTSLTTNAMSLILGQRKIPVPANKPNGVATARPISVTIGGKKIEFPSRTFTSTASAITSAAAKSTFQLSPISRESVVKNNLARLEARWKSCLSGNQNMKAYREMVNIVISVLRRSEVEIIKDEMLKRDVLMRFDAFNERQKLKKMTDDEKKLYVEKKQAEEAKRRRERAELAKIKYEDLEITTQLSLPTPAPIELPAGLAASDFGDVLMVADFVIGFSELLSPVEKFVLTTDSLLKALENLQTSGYEVVGKVFVMFLETLLQSESQIELGMKLEDITVNLYTASELVRILCNPKHADDETDSGFDTSTSSLDTLNGQCMETLMTHDFYSLTPKNLLDMMICLQNKILQSANFDEFLKGKEEELSEAWKEKTDATQDLKKYESVNQKLLKPTTQRSTETSNLAEKIPEETNKPSNALSITHFYGCSSNVKVGSSDSKTGTTSAESLVASRKASLVGSEADESDLSAIESVADIDSMVYKVKSRRANSEKLRAEKEKQEQIERERKKKLIEHQSKEIRLAAALKKLANLQDFLKATLRCNPIGLDRFSNRYWFLPKAFPGRLLVEKVSNTEKPDDPSSISSQWMYYDQIEQIELLCKNLLVKGIRESLLHEHLTKMRDTIFSSIKKQEAATVAANEAPTSEGLEEEKKEDAAELTGVDASDNFRNFIRSELFETESRIRLGGLGGVDEFGVWQARLGTAIIIADFAECLIDVRNAVRPSLLKGIMAVGHAKKGSGSSCNLPKEKAPASSANDNEQHQVTETHACHWLEAVRSCATWSRLTVLYSIFHACVMWEKSAENSPCKICRRRRDDDLTILCDECNDGYHIYCLRPPLKQIPNNDWFCVKCKPKAAKQKPTRSYEESDEEETDASDNSGTEKHDEKCKACNVEHSDEDPFVFCASCRAAFHWECHQPPLRHEPRSGWRCCICVKGVSFGPKSRSTRSRRFE